MGKAHEKFLDGVHFSYDAPYREDPEESKEGKYYDRVYNKAKDKNGPPRTIISHSIGQGEVEVTPNTIGTHDRRYCQIECPLFYAHVLKKIGK